MTIHTAARRPSRLLFITDAGRLEPSSHKRVYDLLPPLRRLGYAPEELSFRWEWLWEARAQATLTTDNYQRHLLRGLNAARILPQLMRARYARALKKLERAVRRADAVIVLRTQCDATWREVLRRYARLLIYDFDDALWLSQREVYERMLEMVHYATAGNEFLAAHARALNPHVTVIPTGVAVEEYDRRARANLNKVALNNSSNTLPPACVIGWIGSFSTARYLAHLVEPLTRLGAERTIILRIVGTGGSELPAFRNVTIETLPRAPYQPAEFVPQFDIGVMPLDDTEWERGKCGAKALEYMAAGVPVVCSAVGENPRIVEHGVSGLTVSNSEEWYRALKLLAADAGLRRAFGAAGRARVEADYSAQVIAGRWHQLLQQLITSPARDKN